jgi:mono/diheme cytochrome c family protein
MRIILGFLLFAAAAVLVAFGAVYGLSEMKLRDLTRGPAFDHPLPEDAASIEHGRRIARTRGCFGCHGQELQGKDFGEQWDWPERAVAVNLAKYAHEHDAATMEAAIRQGIGASGKALMSMPSYNFKNLSDDDTAALIAFLKSAPDVENTLPQGKLGWQVRLDYVRGLETDITDWVAATPDLKIDAATEAERAHGEYLAMTMCNECHGLDVRGQTLFEGDETPDLAIVASYSYEDFLKIITTGIAPDGRELGLMTMVGPDRFTSLTPDETRDLYQYLTSLAAQPAAEDVWWRGQPR